MTKKVLKTKKTGIKLPRSVHRLFPNVRQVVDAAKTVEVSVEAEDCKQGKKFNPAECALARAAKRELHVDGVVIGMSSSYLIRGNTAVRFSTPEAVRREIVSFDRHQDFATGDYTLVPKSPSSRLGEAYRPNRNGSKDKTAKRKVHKSARVRVLDKGVERGAE